MDDKAENPHEGIGMAAGRIRWGGLTTEDTRANVNLDEYNDQPFVLVVGPADMTQDELMAAVSIEMIDE